MEITLKDFKLRFRRVFGAVDDRFNDLVLTCANEIMDSVISLEHVECDKSSFEVFKELENGYFLRPFKAQIGENDLIDFSDHNLVSALFYKCAMHLSTEGLMEYEKEFYKQINAYSARTNDESCGGVEQILIKNKMAIPYIFDERNTQEFYRWDKSFVDTLDFYLANEAANANYKYRRFVWYFKAYQDGDKNARADIVELDKVMSNKLEGALNGNS